MHETTQKGRKNYDMKEADMKWYLEIKTTKGASVFPYNGFKTKREAMEQKALADRIPGNITVRIVTGK